MKKIYTESHLLLFIYNELAQTERLELEQELLVNKQLLKSYEELKESIAGIKELEKEPSEASVNNILDYAQSLSEQHVH